MCGCLKKISLPLLKCDAATLAFENKGGVIVAGGSGTAVQPDPAAIRSGIASSGGRGSCPATAAAATSAGSSTSSLTTAGELPIV